MEDHNIALQDYLNAARKHKLATKELHQATMALVDIVKTEAVGTWFTNEALAQMQDNCDG